MKRAISMLGVVTALAVGFLFAAPPAYADYNGNCADLTQWNGQGNVSITDTNCTLPISITSSGSINISATSVSGSGKNLSGTSVTVDASGGDIEVGTVTSTLNTILSGENVKTSTISSNWGVRVTATDGTLDLTNITSNANNSSFGGNVILTATGNIKTGNITNGGTTTTGGIEIRANTAGTSTAFNIGGGGSNGTGVLDVRNTTGGGSNPGYMPAGIYVVNGDNSSTGGITVDSIGSLLLTSSGGRAGILILDAKNGTLTLPSGTLNAAGSSGNGAGSIFLLANTVSTANGTIITASQDSSASGTYHYVDIAATTISVTGASGLEVKADGDGVSQATASAGLMPKGSISVSSTDSLNSLFWSVSVSAYTTDGPVTVSGSGNIKLTANGDYSRASVSGNGITFSNTGDVTIEAKGDTSHEVTIAYSGSMAGTDLTFSNSGDVILDASAAESGDDGGQVNVFTHKFVMNKDSIEFKANGPTSGNGNGGVIYVSTSWDTGTGFQLNASATAKFEANAASNGTGNATYADPSTGDPRAITLWAGPQTIKVGTDAGQMAFYAKGGTSGGDGGSVRMTGDSIELKKDGALNVSGLAGDGKGGAVETFATITSVDTTIANPFILAKGHGSGRGGQFIGFQFLGGFDINKYIKVDGGDGLLTSAEGNFGRITLNNLACQQRTTGQSSWPKAYWNCASPDGTITEEGNMRDAVVALPSSFKTTLGHADNNAQLYVMGDGDDFNNYFRPSSWIGKPIGYNLPGTYQSGLAVVFEATTQTDQTDYLPGNMMHEIAHLLNAYISPQPIGTGAWTTKSSATEDDMEGTWPNPQAPTCMDVFDSQALCDDYPNTDPWQILQSAYMGGQPVQDELFAFAFQNCSGHEVYALGLVNAERSIYMRDVYDYMDQTFWPGGCVWEP